MRIITDFDEYFAQPWGNVLSRRRFFASLPPIIDGETYPLYAFFAWGALEAFDGEEVYAFFDAVARYTRPGRRQLCVLRSVGHIPMDGILHHLRYFRNQHDYIAGVEREAVVRPDGFVGLMSEGFYRMVPRRYDCKVFTSLEGAVSWLGFDVVTLGPWLDAVTLLERESAHQELALAGLRQVIARRGACVDLEAACRELGVSRRTLQRRLREARTTFSRERAASVVARARELLLTSELDIKHIAHELGYASSVRFVEAFRSETGLPPGQWRERMRGGAMPEWFGAMSE